MAASNADSLVRLGTAAGGELPGATTAGPEGGIGALHHLNFCVTDYYHGMVFYSEGLGATFSTAETAFDRGGLPVAWYNFGHQQQFHVVKAEEAQVLRGFVTLTVPSLDRLEARLRSVASELAGTRFAFQAFPEDGDCPRSVTVRCPWGNAFHVLESAAGAGIQGVHFDCAKGESGLVARHFQRLFGAAVVTEDGVAKVGLGASSFFAFQETGSLPAGFPKSLDHLHVAMFVEDFDAAFSSFEAAALLDTEHRFADKAYSLPAAHEHKQFRVRDVVAEDGRLVYQLELEVRSKSHPSFGKRLQAQPL